MMILCIPAFLSCGKREPVVDTDSVLYYREGSREFGFNFCVLTREKAEMDFVSFSGENVDKMTVTFLEEKADFLPYKVKSGYYLHCIGFICKDLTAEHIKIDSVRLKIDDVEKEYSFATPINHFVVARYDNTKPYNKNDTERERDMGIYSIGSPVFVSTESFRTGHTYRFNFEALENVTVYDFYFNKFLVPKKDAVVKVNDMEKGTLESCFPLKLKKGSKMTIESPVVFLPEVDGENAGYVSCNFFISYKFQDEDKMYTSDQIFGGLNASYEESAKDTAERLYERAKGQSER